jgi:hypothetical protein
MPHMTAKRTPEMVEEEHGAIDDEDQPVRSIVPDASQLDRRRSA